MARDNIYLEFKDITNKKNEDKKTEFINEVNKKLQKFNQQYRLDSYSLIFHSNSVEATNYFLEILRKYSDIFEIIRED